MWGVIGLVSSELFIVCLSYSFLCLLSLCVISPFSRSVGIVPCATGGGGGGEGFETDVYTVEDLWGGQEGGPRESSVAGWVGLSWVGSCSGSTGDDCSVCVDVC